MRTTAPRYSPGRGMDAESTLDRAGGDALDDGLAQENVNDYDWKNRQKDEHIQHALMEPFKASLPGSSTRAEGQHWKETPLTTPLASEAACTVYS